MKTSRRVVVGLSGGIDSTLAVCRLQEAGFEVVGLTLRLRACTSTDGTRRSCCGPDAAGTAGAVARQLGIRHYVRDCASEFEQAVLRPCWEAFAAGQTPNPCVLCNARVRFARLLEFAHEVGATAIATGHYARLDRAPDGSVRLRRGVDPGKDQTYFLHAVPQEVLRAVQFPLGELHKAAVREEVRRRGLANAERAESQDVCFTGPDGQFAEFLRMQFGAEAIPGILRDRTGRVLGTHAGIHRFTLGQRRGLGVAAGVPVRVCALDAANGDVTVSDDPRDLLSDACEAAECFWHGAPPPVGTSVEAQIRYQQKPVPAQVLSLDAQARCIRVQFATPLSAVTPGQYLVLYDGDAVLGGGVIVPTHPPATSAAPPPIPTAGRTATRCWGRRSWEPRKGGGAWRRRGK